MARMILYIVLFTLILVVGYNIFIALNSFLEAYNNNLNTVINSL